jgi:hypothetical protein
MSASSSNTTDNRESAVQTDDSSDWEDSVGEESRPEDKKPDGRTDGKPDEKPKEKLNFQRIDPQSDTKNPQPSLLTALIRRSRSSEPSSDSQSRTHRQPRPLASNSNSIAAPSVRQQIRNGWELAMQVLLELRCCALLHFLKSLGSGGFECPAGVEVTGEVQRLSEVRRVHVVGSGAWSSPSRWAVAWAVAQTSLEKPRLRITPMMTIFSAQL